MNPSHHWALTVLERWNTTQTRHPYPLGRGGVFDRRDKVECNINLCRTFASRLGPCFLPCHPSTRRRRSIHRLADDRFPKKAAHFRCRRAYPAPRPEAPIGLGGGGGVAVKQSAGPMGDNNTWVAFSKHSLGWSRIEHRPSSRDTLLQTLSKCFLPCFTHHKYRVREVCSVFVLELNGQTPEHDAVFPIL